MDNNLLGKKLKEERLERGLSIKEVAEKIEVSSSLLSQIERGLAMPSLNTLRLLADFFEVPMFSLFMSPKEKSEQVEVVRRNDRIHITDGKPTENEDKFSYELLTPDLKGELQLCELNLGPGEVSSSKLKMHDAEEVATCIEGEIVFITDDKEIPVKTGDTVRIKRNTLHTWRNDGDKNCRLIFAMTPPIF
ncbi:cupin domain-containing protein [Peptoniphilus sp.]|jgi:transcriptional regulator with XRE-family HTH domain|uniref:cupin domain-containing protein n=1 Tax=Peptoniphilus sp. TaxID=1971214 RepID=UPI003D92C73C